MPLSWSECFVISVNNRGGLCCLRVVSNGLHHLCGCSQAPEPRRTRPLQEPTHSGYWVCAVSAACLQGPARLRGSDLGIRKRLLLGISLKSCLEKVFFPNFSFLPSFFSCLSFLLFFLKLCESHIRKKRKKCRMGLPVTEGREDKKSDKRWEIRRKMTRMRREEEGQEEEEGEAAAAMWFRKKKIKKCSGQILGIRYDRANLENQGPKLAWFLLWAERKAIF